LLVNGIPNAISTLSARPTGRQLEIIARRFRSLSIAFDGDAPGRDGAVSCAEALRARGLQVDIAALPEGQDINSLAVAGMSRTDLAALLEGAR
jgi:DNA primase